MKLKIDEKGAVVVQDGKPVYVKEDGTEIAFDVVGTAATIARINGEAKSHRERAEAAEGKLKTFEGIEDPEAARKALGTVANLDAKKLIDAGEAEKVRAEITKAFEAKLADAGTLAETLKSQLYGQMVGGAFSRSKFVADKLAIPADMVEARFGKHFAVKDGKVIATDANGNTIYSPANPGEPADFDEALTHLVNAYPQKEHILKGTGAGGGGAGGGNGGGGNQSKGSFGGTRAERTAAIAARFDLPAT